MKAIYFFITAIAMLLTVPSAPSGGGAAAASGGPRGFQAVAPSRVDLITQISSEDMRLLLQHASQALLQEYASSAKSRRDVLRNIQELLAEAVDAIRLGLDDRPMASAQLDFMRALAIAQAYDTDHRRDENSPLFAFLNQRDLDAFLAEPGTAARFDEFVRIARAGKILPDSDLPADQRARTKGEWAKVLLAERIAVAEGYEQRRITQLQITLQQATLLAQLYSTEVLAHRVLASDAELTAYIAANPEFNSAPKRAKAEQILRKVRAGRNFAALARKYSDDPGSKDTGGFYDWFIRGKMVQKFEDAAFKLRLGEVSGIVETQYGYHIIKVVGRRYFRDPDTGKSELQLRVRHILISTIAPVDPDNPLALPMSFKDQAKADLEKGKRNRLLDALIVQTGIIVPDDFDVPIRSAVPTDPALPSAPAKPPPSQ